jgi:hypothetical protein
MSDLFHSIPEVPKNESATNAIARFVDSTGFRYRWATEGLTENEFNFRPHPTSMSMHEVIVHLHQMAFYSNKTFGGVRQKLASLESFMAIRNETLEVYEELSNRLKEMDDSELETCLLNKSNPNPNFPFWFILNGPIADSLTHIGQITSWRRIAGNPQMKGVNPFLGTKK